MSRIARTGIAALVLSSLATAALAAPPAFRRSATGPAPGAAPTSHAGVPAVTVLYDNTGNPANTYYSGQTGAEAVDDLHMVSGGALDAVSFEYYEPGAAGPFTATVRIYSNPGGYDSDLIPLAGPYVVGGLAAGRHLVTVPLPDAPVTAADVWVGVRFSSLTAGLIIRDVPSVGFSHDLYFENGGIFYFGGSPLANFALRVEDNPTYGLNVTTVGQGTVAKSPDLAEYPPNTLVELTASPEAGWHFVEWSGDASGSTNPVGVFMDGPKSVTATFAINTYALGVSVAGQGAVAKAPDQALYDHGTVVQLTATPEAGWTFNGWSGDASGSASPVGVTMDGPKSVTATFTINAYALGVTIVGQGSVAKAPDQALYDHGTVVQLTATPQTGWHFTGWAGDASGPTSPVDVTMDGPRSVAATFAINTYTLTVTKSGQGTVTRTPDLALYDHGTGVDLAASPAFGWRFVDWSGDVAGTSSPVTLLMDADKSVVARFHPNLAPVAGAEAAPQAGPAPLLVELSAATSTDADGDSLAFYWSFGDGAEATGRRVSHTYTLAGNYTALLTVNDGNGGTDTAAVAISASLRFPQTAVLDNFNRSNGAIGSPWTDETAAFSIDGNRLACADDIGYVEWGETAFGPDQEVFATLSAFHPAAWELNLMLKTQGANWRSSHIEVSYSPSASRVFVRTLVPPEAWTTWAAFTGVTFAAGDQFGARAGADGTVEVFRNGVRLGSASVAGWAFASLGGRIGVSYDAAAPSWFDDFGGGDLAEPAAGPLVISQVYGGGGSAGSTLTHDFIELFNRGSQPVDLAGWSVQYAAASGTTWSVTPLAGVIQAGGYYLIQENGGANGSVPLPAPDAVGSFGLGANAGKVALVRRTTPLTGACPGDAWMVDLVGYGSATCSEGSPVAGVNNLSAPQRREGGCTDTGDNAADFVVGTPAPRNSASPAQPCAAWLAVEEAHGPRLELGAPTPNPVRRSLHLSFALPQAADVRIRLLDLQGRLVATLADGGFGAGRHDVTWTGATSRGTVAAGIYFIRMDALKQSRVRKVVVTR